MRDLVEMPPFNRKDAMKLPHNPSKAELSIGNVMVAIRTMRDHREAQRFVISDMRRIYWIVTGTRKQFNVAKFIVDELNRHPATGRRLRFDEVRCCIDQRVRPAGEWGVIDSDGRCMLVEC